MLYVFCLAGTCRIHDTQWECPEGKAIDPLNLAMTHYTTENDCAVYQVSSTREVPLEDVEFEEHEREEFLLDMDRAMSILKDAFKGVKKEPLEMSIISFQQVSQLSIAVYL